MNRATFQVDGFIRNAKQWQIEFEKLRAIVREFPLEEDLKWGKPCYTLEKKNVVLIHGFKEYCALLFFKGALLADADKIFSTPGNTQAGRQIRFTSAGEITKMKPLIKAYIQEAIDAEKAGRKVKLKTTAEFTIPVELQDKFAAQPAMKKAFQALTPGRQRGYILHFSAPKQSKTRVSRIEKCVKQILKGQGLND